MNLLEYRLLAFKKRGWSYAFVAGDQTLLVENNNVDVKIFEKEKLIGVFGKNPADLTDFIAATVDTLAYKPLVGMIRGGTICLGNSEVAVRDTKKFKAGIETILKFGYACTVGLVLMNRFSIVQTNNLELIPQVNVSIVSPEETYSGNATDNLRVNTYGQLTFPDKLIKDGIASMNATTINSATMTIEPQTMPHVYSNMNDSAVLTTCALEMLKTTGAFKAALKTTLLDGASASVIAAQLKELTIDDKHNINYIFGGGLNFAYNIDNCNCANEVHTDLGMIFSTLTLKNINAILDQKIITSVGATIIDALAAVSGGTNTNITNKLAITLEKLETKGIAGTEDSIKNITPTMVLKSHTPQNISGALESTIIPSAGTTLVFTRIPIRADIDTVVTSYIDVSISFMSAHKIAIDENSINPCLNFSLVKATTNKGTFETNVKLRQILSNAKANVAEKTLLKHLDNYSLNYVDAMYDQIYVDQTTLENLHYYIIY